ncbi:unnamed protein product [Symbiodinium sp. CCMP2456]|nr:unnamed protein product [Symbiodinium sp. CCMP2456]
MAELRYTKDGVPIYDGTPEMFVPYRRAALIYVETVEWKKRSLAGPRLQAALEGAARMVVEHKAPGWISHVNGASQLLECLKQQVRSPTLAEAGRTMSRFFYGIKRRRGEGMAAWIVRHDEALLEAKRTLAETIQEYGPGQKVASSRSSTSWRTPRRGESRGQGSSELGGTQPDEEFAETADAEAEAENENAHETEEVPEGSEDNTDWWDQDWQGGWESWDQAERFLPDFVIAWLLLQRSGLDTTEKSVIVANLWNNFSTQKVKEALKLTWPDEELRKRDSGKNGAMFATEEEALLADEEGFEPVETPSWEDPEEGYAYQALEDDAQEALAALEDASSRPPIKCFRCGGNHLRRDCPQAASGNTGDQRVHFVFSAVDDKATAEPDAKDDDTAATEASLLALDEIVAIGKAIIDGGVTSSLGSEEALQQVAMLNWKATGRDSIEIVPEERPSFRFGNNAQHTCLSTALLRLPISCKASHMRVHIHDIPGQPVLLSVKSLRALGAVIDFSNDQAVFKALDPKAVVSLGPPAVDTSCFLWPRTCLKGLLRLSIRLARSSSM